MSYEKIPACRSCGSKDLVDILSLGVMYVSNFVEETTERSPRAPMDLVLCGECSLLQLHHVGVPTRILYKKYWYRSGVNESMIKALKDITSTAEELTGLKEGDIVLDIGANDGTLLDQYETPGITKAAFEPAENLLPELLKSAKYVVPGVFDYEAYKNAIGDYGAKVITSIAMFYDLEDPNSFVADIKKTLHEDGLWVIQMSYLPAMLETNAFDNICHEHLEYYSLTSLEPLIERHGMKIIKVEENDVNGGSFRVYVVHEDDDRRMGTSVEMMRAKERDLGLDTVVPYNEFADRVEDIKERTLEFIDAALEDSKKIYVYGASTKGNTLLQYYGLDNTSILGAAERSHAKYGLRTVGSDIPIMSEADVRADNPDYFLILPWHFLEGFVKREKKFLNGGGAFIVPLPDFMII